MLLVMSYWGDCANCKAASQSDGRIVFQTGDRPPAPELTDEELKALLDRLEKAARLETAFQASQAYIKALEAERDGLRAEIAAKDRVIATMSELLNRLEALTRNSDQRLAEKDKVIGELAGALRKKTGKLPAFLTGLFLGGLAGAAADGGN